ncbi:hypothetical protein [Natrinema sp. 1APR25-10V2]|uniref:hypothetical protein n=1 Tax=Natrinema sp. 1APR25-10V2 TaxID=2951081 RepID=UPI00287542F9|nr:hypothetical protein [Natrinema sp. 1APR25-10V2]MDS0475283.1 hypothetical protein [Natrinema sp. 1APR25-10V2]
MTASDDSEKAPGVCENCGELLPVWVTRDGTVRPISPHNDCSCADPSLRVVDEDDVFEAPEEQPTE